jgi:hypothetical protein
MNVGGDILWILGYPRIPAVYEGFAFERDLLEVPLLAPLPPASCNQRARRHVFERNAIDDSVYQLSLGEMFHS